MGRGLRGRRPSQVTTGDARAGGGPQDNRLCTVRRLVTAGRWLVLSALRLFCLTDGYVP